MGYLRADPMEYDSYSYLILNDKTGETIGYVEISPFPDNPIQYYMEDYKANEYYIKHDAKTEEEAVQSIANTWMDRIKKMGYIRLVNRFGESMGANPEGDLDAFDSKGYFLGWIVKVNGRWYLHGAIQESMENCISSLQRDLNRVERVRMQ